jgi:choice-of-anchor B domain-containing protein
MRRKLYPALAAIVAILGLAAVDITIVDLTDDRLHARIHDQKVVDMAANDSSDIPTEQTGFTPCVENMAGAFPCDGIDLLSFIPLADLGFVETSALGGGASDLWGWTSPGSGKEYVLIAHTNGTAAVDVTTPTDPVYLGSIPNTSPVQLIWHDIKIVNDHAVIASESAAHGLQILDLSKLDDMDGSTSALPIAFDAFYPLSGAQHNVVENPSRDQIIVVGGSIAALGLPADQCDSGLNIIDMSNPLLPTPAGCYAGSEYIHDSECVDYQGPDEEYRGRNICVNYAEDHISIVDITDPADGTEISRITYDDTRYTHQGWFTEDFRYILANDELDEQSAPDVTHTRTLVYDVTDLDKPVEHLIALRDGSDGNPETESIDHNNYTHEGLAYQSNYTAGLRVIDMAGLDVAPADGGPQWNEVAFFDTYPADDDATFNGTWSNYPYFESGTIAVSGIGEGLFLVRLHEDRVAGSTLPPAADTDADGAVGDALPPASSTAPGVFRRPDRPRGAADRG